MILESAVREKLAAVARNAISLNDLANWIDAEGWNMHRDSAADAVDLASSIHLLLGERDDGVIDEAALRRELLSLLNNVVVSPAPRVFSASRVYWVGPTQPWSLHAVA